jgi:hypothetical protein
LYLRTQEKRGNYKKEFGGEEGQFWQETVLLDGTALHCTILLVLPELLYTPEVYRRRGAGSYEEARSSGEVLCSVYAAARAG